MKLAFNKHHSNHTLSQQITAMNNLYFKNKKFLILASAIGLGLLAGFLYWRFVGCTSGSCPLTAKWYTSTLFGGVFGYLIGDSFTSKQKGNQSEMPTVDK